MIYTLLYIRVAKEVVATLSVHKEAVVNEQNNINFSG